MNYRKLTEIVIDQARLREDMGDMAGLQASILRNFEHLPSTRGLMHPVVIDLNNNLIAGGRRFTAFQTLANSNKVFEDIPVTMVEDLSPAVRRQLEIEENLRRKEMTWQENLVGIVDYHRLATKEALRNHLTWSQEATGEILGVSQTSVSLAVRLVKEMKKAPDSSIAKAGTMLEAIQLMAARERDAAAKIQLDRINTRRTEAAKDIKLASAQIVTTVNPANIVLPQMKKDEPLLSVEDISKFYYHGNCLDLIPRIAASGPIHHFITDPPFAVDTDNQTAGTGKIDRIADTHTVAGNLELLPEFLSTAFKHIQEDGFLCMWYDLDHHEKLKEWATKIGWRVTRWPFTWVKTSPCSNSQAQYNITKATEVCMIMRRSEKSIIKVKQPKNWLACDAIKHSSHPYVKPPEVWDYLLDVCATEGQIVVDAFAGEGSMLAQAFKRKLQPIGIEIDQNHIANGLNYIQERIGKRVQNEGLLSELPI